MAAAGRGMQVISDPAEARRAVRAAQATGQRVGLVPTMGALHAGHLALVAASQSECAVTAVTIFVNPSQFAPHEDFQRYPRPLEEDLAKLRAAGTGLVFVPDRSAIYPPGFSTYVEPPSVAAPLEGVIRPGHFRGVATIVLKLFQILPADRAYFGQKDYQQTLVVRRMATDFDLPIEIRVCDTVREPDGLALSSRNQYLSAAERQQATALYRSLERGAELLRSGQRSRQSIEHAMRNELEAAGINAIDYIAIANPETLAETPEVQLPVVLLIAARVGTTRLIDNRIVH